MQEKRKENEYSLEYLKHKTQTFIQIIQLFPHSLIFIPSEFHRITFQ